LNRRGIKRVRPLAGGFTSWIERGYPVEQVEETITAVKV
jgi:3-mercaptopyruvate sulfurtransferase SseA